jgi:hypothetical protein
LPLTFYQLSNTLNGKSHNSALRQTLSKTNNIFQSNDRYDSSHKQPWAKSKFAEEGAPPDPKPHQCIDGLAIGLQQYDQRQEKKVHFSIDVKSGPTQLEDNKDIGGEESSVPPQGYLWSHHAAPVPKSQAICSAWNRTQVIHMQEASKHIFGNSTCYINTPRSPQQRYMNRGKWSPYRVFIPKLCLCLVHRTRKDATYPVYQAKHATVLRVHVGTHPFGGGKHPPHPPILSLK